MPSLEQLLQETNDKIVSNNSLICAHEKELLFIDGILRSTYGNAQDLIDDRNSTNKALNALYAERSTLIKKSIQLKEEITNV